MDNLREAANSFVAVTREELIQLRRTTDVITARQDAILARLIEIDKKLEHLAERQIDDRDLQTINKLENNWGDITRSVGFYRQFVESTFDRNPIVDRLLRMNESYAQIEDCVAFKKESEDSNFREVNSLIRKKLPMGWWGFLIVLICLILLTKETLSLLQKFLS